jgi:hypothetical protein
VAIHVCCYAILDRIHRVHEWFNLLVTAERRKLQGGVVNKSFVVKLSVEERESMLEKKV